MKYSKFIVSFCETDKCEYFSYETQGVWNINKLKSVPKDFKYLENKGYYK